MGNESAVIIPIPEAESLVGLLRLQYDASARLGVPAHVTVLYPFCSAEVAVSQMQALRDTCQSIETIPFAFTEVRRFEATVYLHPDKPISLDLLRPYDARLMRSYAVSSRVNHVVNDDEACSARIEVVETQRHLF